MSQELRFGTLSMRNFISYGNQAVEVDLSYIGSSFLVGENVDRGGANGVGKSTIINALTYILYNKPRDNISLQRLINSTNSTKNTLMEVSLTFTKGVDAWEVYRCRGESTNVRLTCNGVDVTPDSVAEADAKLEEVVGISYELFTNVIIFAGSMTPFLEMSIGNQRRLIEELFNISLLSEKAEKLKEKIRQTDLDMASQSAIVKEQENAIRAHAQRITAAEQRLTDWEDNRKQQLATIKASLASVENLDLVEEKELHAAASSVKAELTSIESKLRAYNRDIESYNKAIKSANEKLVHLRDDKCPFCLQNLPDAPAKIEKYEAELQETTVKLDLVVHNISFTEGEQARLSEDLIDLKASIQYPNLEELLRTQANMDKLTEKLAELKAAVNPHVDTLEALLSEDLKEPDFDRLDYLKSKHEHQKFLLKLLTDKNSFLRRKIISKTVPFLNLRLNHYTNSLGLPHVVKFDDNMSCAVSEFGRELDFGNISGGEKKRVNLAMSLAFRDVLHQLHCRFNVLFFDEIDGGALCPDGTDAVIKLIKEKSLAEELGYWIISHQPAFKGRFDRDVIIRKEHGFSSIIFPNGDK